MTPAEKRLLVDLHKWELPEARDRRGPTSRLFPLHGAEHRTAQRLWDRRPPLVYVGSGGVAFLTAEGKIVAASLATERAKEDSK